MICLTLAVNKSCKRIVNFTWIEQLASQWDQISSKLALGKHQRTTIYQAIVSLVWFSFPICSKKKEVEDVSSNAWGNQFKSQNH